MLVLKGNTLLSPTSALSNMLPRHKSMTFQGSHQKWHRPAAIRTKISWWKPHWQLDNSTFTLWKIWTFVFPPVFYNCRQGAKRKVTWKGQKQSVPRSRCWICLNDTGMDVSRKKNIYKTRKIWDEWGIREPKVWTLEKPPSESISIPSLVLLGTMSGCSGRSKRSNKERNHEHMQPHQQII